MKYPNGIACVWGLEEEAVIDLHNGSGYRFMLGAKEEGKNSKGISI